MSLRPLFLAGLVGVASTPTAFAQTPASPPAEAAPETAPESVVNLATNPNEVIDALKLPDAPLETMLTTLEELTGRTVLRPAQLGTGGNYSLVINRPITRAEAILALETVLNLNNVGLVPLGDKFIKVVNIGNVRTEAPRFIEGSTLQLPASGAMATKVFMLDFQRAPEFVAQLGMMLNPNMGGATVFEKANAILVTDSISTLQRIEVLIRELDKPITTNLTPKFYTLRFAKASNLVNQMRTILQGVLQTQLGTATSYSADDRTNQVILISDPRQHAFFDELIGKLDVKADPNTRNEVIYLKHAAAKDVATLVSQLVSGQNQAASKSGQQSARPAQVGPMPDQPPPPPSPEGVVTNSGLLNTTAEFSSLVTILPDERSNGVVVSGTVDDIRLIRELVEKIDVLLAQVRIDVVIAEVSLSDNQSTGISALGLNVVQGKLVGFSGAGPGLSVAGSGDNSFAQIVTSPTGDKDLTSVIRISTTPRKNNATILSVPSITTTHNKEAFIFTGQTQPVISSFFNDPATTTGGTYAGRTQLTQQEIGTKLTVKPLIGADGSVQLEVKQNVSSLGGSVTIDGNAQPIINKRETESFISVKSGEIIVLGGLQSKSSTLETNRLGPIPILGDLFGSRVSAKQRTELIFFLRPTVLTNSPADNENTIERLERLKNREEINRALKSQPLEAERTNKTALDSKTSSPQIRRPR